MLAVFYSGFVADSMGQFGGLPGLRGGRDVRMPTPFDPERMQTFAPPPPPMPDGRDTRHVDESRFLRGVPITNQRGVVEFSSIYPGWYVGRAIHIHLNVHIGGAMAADTYSGGHLSHPGNCFFRKRSRSRSPVLSASMFTARCRNRMAFSARSRAAVPSCTWKKRPVRMVWWRR